MRNEKWRKKTRTEIVIEIPHVRLNVKAIYMNILQPTYMLGIGNEITTKMKKKEII